MWPQRLQGSQAGFGASQHELRCSIPVSLARWPPHGSQGFGSQAGLQHFGFSQHLISIFGKQSFGSSILWQHFGAQGFGAQHFGAQGFGAQHFGAQGFGSQHFGFSQQP